MYHISLSPVSNIINSTSAILSSNLQLRNGWKLHQGYIPIVPVKNVNQLSSIDFIQQIIVLPLSLQFQEVKQPQSFVCPPLSSSSLLEHLLSF